MAKYRKKPVVIEAMRYFPSTTMDDLLAFAGAVDSTGQVPSPQSLFAFRRGELFVVTLEGDMLVSPGDWIIRGIAGEFYPCKDSIFRATYEPLLEET